MVEAQEEKHQHFFGGWGSREDFIEEREFGLGPEGWMCLGHSWQGVGSRIKDAGHGVEGK